MYDFFVLQAVCIIFVEIYFSNSLLYKQIIIHENKSKEFY